MILALDIGGTSVKMGLADEQGVLYEKAEADVSFDGITSPSAGQAYPPPDKSTTEAAW